MYIGKVIGSVVSTVKISHLEGRTLLLVDQLDLAGKETGAYDIAVDTVQAGPGDTVLVMDEGNRCAPDPRARSRRDPSRRRGRRRRGERGRLGRQRGALGGPLLTGCDVIRTSPGEHLDEACRCESDERDATLLEPGEQPSHVPQVPRCRSRSVAQRQVVLEELKQPPCPRRQRRHTRVPRPHERPAPRQSVDEARIRATEPASGHPPQLLWSGSFDSLTAPHRVGFHCVDTVSTTSEYTRCRWSKDVHFHPRLSLGGVLPPRHQEGQVLTTT